MPGCDLHSGLRQEKPNRPDRDISYLKLNEGMPDPVARGGIDLIYSDVDSTSASSLALRRRLSYTNGARH